MAITSLFQKVIMITSCYDHLAFTTLLWPSYNQVFISGGCYGNLVTLNILLSISLFGKPLLLNYKSLIFCKTKQNKHTNPYYDANVLNPVTLGKDIPRPQECCSIRLHTRMNSCIKSKHQFIQGAGAQKSPHKTLRH